jgi:photosystem II stability/assembly factor-like uncharacterized protein
MIGVAAGILLAALALTIATSLGAARAPGGLPGGAVLAIAAHPRSPDTLVAATTPGLFRSQDGGMAWQKLAQPQDPGRIGQLLFASDGEVLYAAGTLGLAMLRDGETVWQRASALEQIEIVALAASPLDGALYVASHRQVWRSPDRGATWAALAVPEGAGVISALAAHPTSAGILYLGAEGGLFVSGDRGATWYPVRPGPIHQPVTWVGFWETNGTRRLYAASADALWRSADDGATWQSVSLPSQIVVQEQPIPWSVSPFMVEGASGLPTLAPGERLLSAASTAASPPRLYLGTTRTLYASADGGRSWRDLVGQPAEASPGRSPWQKVLYGLPPYLAGAGLMLALWGAGMMWRERREARRQALDSQGAGVRWDDIIADALLRHQRVTPDLLERIPGQARVHAMIRYVDAHRDQALIFQDAPPLIAPARGDRLRAFADTWNDLTQKLGQREAAVAAASHLIEQLCGLLGFEPVERRVYRSLAGYMVEAPTLRLSLPARFPIIVLLKDSLEREDVRDIRALMSALNAVSFFALLIPVGAPLDGARPAQAMQGLAREGAEDLIVLDYRELYGLHLAADAESDLVRRILDQVDLTVVSPYVLSGPVPPKMFFGRDYEIKVIMRTVQDRSFAIVGGRKIGKTSILNKVHRLLQQTEGYNPLYLDCHHVTTYEDFFEALSVMSEVSAESAAPDMLRRIVVRLRGRQGDPSQTLVFLLDEVDHLLRYDLQQGTLLFRVFRSLSQEGLCRFVFCGERTLDTALRDPSSPLFNFCSTLRLGYLQERDAERIVQEPMQEMGITFEAPELIPQEIVALSGCHPNIVQAICQYLIERINQRQERVIRASDLAQVRNSTEFRDLFFEVSWGNATTLERLITVLMAGRGRFGPQQVRQALQGASIALSDAELESVLNNLVLTSLIKRQGQQLEYTSAAFARVLEEAGLAEGLRDGLVEKLLEERRDHSATPSQK